MFPVPNYLYRESTKLSFWLNSINPDGLILSGGNDLDAYVSRDSLEISLLKYSINFKLPILGICRGMQIIAKFHGAILMPIDNHVNVRHKLIGDSYNVVNSYHNFGILEPPNGFNVTHKAEDGSIEGIKSYNGKILGLMWHPERNTDYDESDIKLIGDLFD